MLPRFSRIAECVSTSFFFVAKSYTIWASQVMWMIKNPPANAGDIKDAGSMSGLGRSPGRRHGNPLQYSCLENPMDRGVWQSTVHWVAESRTRQKQLCTHIRCMPFMNRPHFAYRIISWVVFTLGLLWAMLLQTLMYKILHEHKFSILLRYT